MYEVKIPNVVFRSLLRSMAFGPILVCNPTGFCSIRESITSHGLYCRAKITHGETKQALIFTESSEILHDYIFIVPEQKKNRNMRNFNKTISQTV